MFSILISSPKFCLLMGNGYHSLSYISLWLFIVLVAVVNAASTWFPSSQMSFDHSSKVVLYTEKFYTQILDHFTFTPQSYQTFQQRYLVNDTSWGGAEKNAPIFVYTGNEGDVEWFAQNTGFMFDIAPRFQAMLVFIEHRFYGKSMPFGGDKEVAYSNASTLGYLTSTQALADYATLLINLKKNLSASESPVVVFGGSYGGMLAAWFRLKYPHLAIGALASSAPILDFEHITSPYDFFDIVSNDFKSASENCYRVIKDSWKLISEALKDAKESQMLRRKFRVCSNSSLDHLASWFFKALMYTAMTDYPTPSNFLNPMPAYPVKQMCNAIDDPEKRNDTFSKLHGAANIYYNYTGSVDCFNPGDHSDSHGSHIWSWQATTELIMSVGASSNISMFPPNEWDYRTDGIPEVNSWGVKSRPYWITTEYGGHNIKMVLKKFGSNIIFFNGLRDPWSGGGVLENISSTIVAIVAKKGAHHVDLRFASNADPRWLQRIRRREIKIIAKWLQEYYQAFS